MYIHVINIFSDSLAWVRVSDSTSFILTMELLLLVKLERFILLTYICFSISDSIALFTDDRSCRRYEASKKSFNFSIDANGSFLIHERKIWKKYEVEDLMYCMETSYNTTTKQSRNVFKLCVISNANAIKFKISSPAMVISCVCLLITILTYIFVHKLKKIIERIIVCYCFFLMVFYVLTILVHTISDLGKYCEVVGKIFKYISVTLYVLCLILGFTLFFSYIASFSWMNVLSFDIYRTVA